MTDFYVDNSKREREKERESKVYQRNEKCGADRLYK
jgi:hypothetical protein